MSIIANQEDKLVVSINKHPMSQGAQVTVPTSIIDKDFWKKVMLYQFLYSMTGLVIGLICSLMGAVLFVLGVAASGHWNATFFGITINDAAPGSVLFIVGTACWYLTKFDVSLSAAGDEPAPAPAPTPAPNGPAKG